MGRTKLDLFYFVGSASVLVVALYFNALAFHRTWLEGNSAAPDSYSVLYVLQCVVIPSTSLQVT
jgi:hypothetical protein